MSRSKINDGNKCGKPQNGLIKAFQKKGYAQKKAPIGRSSTTQKSPPNGNKKQGGRWGEASKYDQK